MSLCMMDNWADRTTATPIATIRKIQGATARSSLEIVAVYPGGVIVRDLDRGTRAIPFVAPNINVISTTDMARPRAPRPAPLVKFLPGNARNAICSCGCRQKRKRCPNGGMHAL